MLDEAQGSIGYDEVLKRVNQYDRLTALTRELREALLGLHSPLRHDYEKDEAKCQTCSLLQRSKGAGE